MIILSIVLQFYPIFRNVVRIVHYIVFDLEWNQSPKGKEGTVDHLPFEIIEIGAVKLDEGLEQVGGVQAADLPKGLHTDAL